MKVLAVLVLSIVVLTGCKDPNACGPGDVDRDHDGICHEK
jgi:hypothetical protein